MINQICRETDIFMEKCFDVFMKYLSKIRTGRAIPSLLDNIHVKYYDGHLVPLCKIANIISENFRTLSITVFDRNLISSVKKAILSSDLGLNPISTDEVIRVFLPPLTEENRCRLIKKIRAEAEQSKMTIRNIRRHANDKIKKLSKDKTINKDEDRYLQDKIQKSTIRWVKKIDNILVKKERELMDL